LLWRIRKSLSHDPGAGGPACAGIAKEKQTWNF
jgi:hypothetical protein